MGRVLGPALFRDSDNTLAYITARGVLVGGAYHEAIPFAVGLIVAFLLLSAARSREHWRPDAVDARSLGITQLSG